MLYKLNDNKKIPLKGVGLFGHFTQFAKLHRFIRAHYTYE